MKFILLSLLQLLGSLLSDTCKAQNNRSLISGPRADNIELRTATIWLEVSPSVKSVAVLYHKSLMKNSSTVKYTGLLGMEFNPIKIELHDLAINSEYSYVILIDGKPIHFPYPLKFKTKDLWQWRKPAPDFTFLMGSCAYFNEPVYDRPGKPYGGDSSIFESMANTGAAFQLWLGDNWYTREADYFSPWGLSYRAHRDMGLPVLQRLFASMPQYATWDDHDYGPDDEGLSFILKEESRKVFMQYWCNPSYGEDGKGIYTKINYSDADIFLTDDRYFRSEDGIRDTIDGVPNKEKSFFGTKQMDWLKNSLVYSRSTFKIIAVGSQVLNPIAPSSVECMRTYSSEFNELTEFITKQKITGVLFISGDRHHSEVTKIERPGTYALYDITTSPFTAGISKVTGNEINSPYRVPGTLVQEQNYARVTISGKPKERQLAIEFFGVHGNKLAGWSVNETELK